MELTRVINCGDNQQFVFEARDGMKISQLQLKLAKVLDLVYEPPIFVRSFLKYPIIPLPNTYLDTGLSCSHVCSSNHFKSFNILCPLHQQYLPHLFNVPIFPLTKKHKRQCVIVETTTPVNAQTITLTHIQNHLICSLAVLCVSYLQTSQEPVSIQARSQLVSTLETFVFSETNRREPVFYSGICYPQEAGGTFEICIEPNAPISDVRFALHTKEQVDIAALFLYNGLFYKMFEQKELPVVWDFGCADYANHKSKLRFKLDFLSPLLCACEFSIICNVSIIIEHDASKQESVLIPFLRFK
jgi:hypothetical protein